MRYPGGKGKVYQHVINLLPPHSTYIETHLGGGAVLRHKRPAANNIGIDIDPNVIRIWREQFPNRATLIRDDAVSFLRRSRFDHQHVIYADPPYVPSTRRAQKVYRFEYSDTDHENLLSTLLELPCHVVISGYPSDLYERYLRGWNSRSFMAKAHDGLREERLWFNYSAPEKLHDDRFIGDNFHQRQNIRRRLSTLRRRISDLSTQEQHHLLDWLNTALKGEDGS